MRVGLPCPEGGDLFRRVSCRHVRSSMDQSGIASAMTEYRIPFNRPGFLGNEQAYIAEAIARGQISGNGHFTRKCQALLEEELGAAKVLLTTSCTDALEMCALLLDIGPDDEVILPSFTFVSTANAFVLRGARPVFVDIRPDTLNLDETQIEEAISPRTRAIVPVHYAGVGCQMDAIATIAARHSLCVVEDNAHGLFGSFGGRALGTFGALATLSFHETKNVICGEGGALVINDSKLCERAEILWEKGTDRSRFFRGQVDKYTWVDVGSSFLPSDLVAAFLFGQLEQRALIQARRREVWQRYDASLSAWADAHGVRRPIVPLACQQPFHLYYLLLPNRAARDALIAHLKTHGILAVFHYLPLHASPVGVQFRRGGNGCPVTEDVSDRLVRLPFFTNLSGEMQAEVISAVCEFTP